LIFKTLSKDEYERLSVDDRMSYLHRLMTDIREKLAETRLQHAATQKKLSDESKKP
jgi:hypothetical protein